jgi:hypothetical protein
MNKSKSRSSRMKALAIATNDQSNFSSTVASKFWFGPIGPKSAGLQKS